MEEQNGVEAYSYNVGIFYDNKIRVYLLMVGFEGDESKFGDTFASLSDTLGCSREINAHLITRFRHKVAFAPLP